MRKMMLSTALAAALAMAPLAGAAFAAGAEPSHGPSHVAALHKASTAKAPRAQSRKESLAFPVCDATHTNHCIELGKHKWLDAQTNRAYPQCAKIKSLTKKAACINTAFDHQHMGKKQTKRS